MIALEVVLVAFVVAGAMPPVVGVLPFVLGEHAPLPAPRASTVAPMFPRVAIVVPAWNEAAVLGRTLDRLAALEYPRERAARLRRRRCQHRRRRPTLVAGKAAEHPGLIFHLRREQGGEGKAHTINHGLRDDHAPRTGTRRC